MNPDEILRSDIKSSLTKSGILLFLAFKTFSREFGSGGAERWLFYPIIFWLTGIGTYLLGIKDGHKNTIKANK
jgi:hypothetical protein